MKGIQWVNRKKKRRNIDNKKADNPSNINDNGKNCSSISNASFSGTEESKTEGGEDGEGDGFSGNGEHADPEATSIERHLFRVPQDTDKLSTCKNVNKHVVSNLRNLKFDEVDGNSEPNSPTSGPSNGRGSLIEFAVRLVTFQLWPKECLISGRELARCGFYYLEDKDRVQCVHCNLILKDWELGDDAVVEHKKFSQHCQFEQYMDQESKHSNFVGEPSLGISFEHPKYPEYAVEYNRLKTFTDWTSNIKQTAEAIAKAGFFFIGKPDRVKCFYCGLKLHNWLQDDEPWFEHARHRAECTYVQQCKGEDFVTRVKEAVEKGLRHLIAVVQVPEVLPPSTPNEHLSNQQQEDKKNVNIEEYMNMPSVRSLLEIMMVSQNLVTKALTRFLEKSDKCPDAATLMDFVYQIEDEDKKSKDLKEAEDNQKISEKESSPTGIGALQGGACGTLADEIATKHTYQSLFPTISSEIPNRPTTPTGGLLSSQQVPLPNVGFKQEDELPPDTSNGSEELCDITENHRPKSVLNREVHGYETNGDDDSEDIYGEGLTEKEIQDLKRQEEEELSKLKSENEQLQQERRCKICLDEVASILFLPCGHLVCCTACSPALRLCPICRKMVQGTVKTFRV